VPVAVALALDFTRISIKLISERSVPYWRRT
jgi:hypothetical protein